MSTDSISELIDLTQPKSGIIKKIEDGKHAKIYVTMENDDQTCYDRVIKIYNVPGNVLAITQLSDGNQELWENNPGEEMQHLGDLIGIPYNSLIGNYKYIKKIEIFTDYENTIELHKYYESFKSSKIVVAT